MAARATKRLVITVEVTRVAFYARRGRRKDLLTTNSRQSVRLGFFCFRRYTRARQIRSRM